MQSKTLNLILITNFKNYKYLKFKTKKFTTSPKILINLKQLQLVNSKLKLILKPRGISKKILTYLKKKNNQINVSKLKSQYTLTLYLNYKLKSVKLMNKEEVQVHLLIRTHREVI